MSAGYSDLSFDIKARYSGRAFFAHQWLSLIIFTSVAELRHDGPPTVIEWWGTITSRSYPVPHNGLPTKGSRTVTRGVADQERIIGRQSSNRSFGFLDHTFQSGYLSEEFHSRLRGTAEQHCAGRYIGNHPRLCANLRPLPDPQVPSHGSLAADLNEILKDCGSRNSNLGDDDAATSQAHIMADLD